MTLTADDGVLLVSLRPHYEGANIGTWIGFKHLLYLIEEAVLQWFRERGIGPQRLYHEYDLGLEIVDSSALLLTLLEIDDEVTAEVTPRWPGLFSVRLLVKREVPTVVLKSKVKVVLVKGKKAREVKPVPDNIAPLVVPNVAQAMTDIARRDLRIAPGEQPCAVLTPRDSPTFLWSWQARYFHCHYSERVQHSSYVRALEEVVDRFLNERGLAIGRVLDEQGLIPVVSRARVQLIADAYMEETIHTTFVVEDIFKETVYDARMDCYVQRGETLAHTATARILHGYAISKGEDAGRLTRLNESTLAALTSETRV
jgi:acyl-CoA thioesterase FadM